VIDDGKLVRIVTYSDLLKVPAGERGKTTVEEVMTTKLHLIYPDDDVYSALNKMEKYHVGRLPVVNPDDPAALLGIITRSDIVILQCSKE